VGLSLSFTLINCLSFTPRPSLRISAQLCNDPGLCNTHQSWQKVCVCVRERTFRAHVFQQRASSAAVLWETNKELLLCVWWDSVMRGETGALCVCVCFLGTLLIGWWATAAVGTDCWLAICHQEKCVWLLSWVLSSLRRGEKMVGGKEWMRKRETHKHADVARHNGWNSRLDIGPLFTWLVWEETGIFGVCEILESYLQCTYYLTVFENYIDAVSI